jgi:transcriptional regulator with XRE-family HTH domain
MGIVIGRCRIPHLLRERGWTQQELANRTGLDKRTISFYCTNARKRMTLFNAVIIADVLGVDNPRDLYEWDYVSGE